MTTRIGLIALDRHEPVNCSCLSETAVIRFVIHIVTRLDPWMSRTEARRIRQRSEELLGELEADADYARLPSLLPEAFRAVLGGLIDPGLAFYAAPAEGRIRGAVIALHGHGGNPKLWLHGWRSWAASQHCLVLCPCFGYGNWEHRKSNVCISRWRDLLRQYDSLEWVLLAGISQGGCGVSRGGAAYAEQFDGLIFLSPTLEPEIITSEQFIRGWRHRPVFVCYGGRDHNVSANRVATAIALMKANGVEMTEFYDPAADHFLFFDQTEEILEALAAWRHCRVKLPRNPVDG
jgi:pimeloyl-ACP methyl ester carboxylesterase